MMSTFTEPTTTIDGLSLDVAHVSVVPSAAGSTSASVKSVTAQAATNDRAIANGTAAVRKSRLMTSGKGLSQTPNLYKFGVFLFLP